MENSTVNKKLSQEDILKTVLWTCSSKEPESDFRVFKPLNRIYDIVFMAQYGFLEFQTLINSGIFVENDRFKFKLGNFFLSSIDLKDCIYDFFSKENLIQEIEDSVKFNERFRDQLSEVSALVEENQTLKRWIWKIRGLGELDEMALKRFVYQSNAFIKEFLEPMI